MVAVETVTRTKVDCTLSAPEPGVLPRPPGRLTPDASAPPGSRLQKTFRSQRPLLTRSLEAGGFDRTNQRPDQFLSEPKLAALGTVRTTKYPPHQERVDDRLVYQMPEEGLIPLHTLSTNRVVRGHLVGDINTSLAKIIVQDNPGLGLGLSWFSALDLL